MSSDAYQAGDPEAVAARYRIHFKPALKRPEDYERLMATMNAEFISQGKEGILKARAVEDQLMRDTWQVAGYDLLPKLRSLAYSDAGHHWGPRFHPGGDRRAHLTGHSRCAGTSYSGTAGISRILNPLGTCGNALDDFFRIKALPR